MLNASLVLDPAFRIGAVRRRMFGTLVEHMGRCVYTGLYEPGHASADEHGFRADVLALARELGVTTARYPGGNFVSGYRWEDGVGPASDRPRRLDLAWHSLETNAFGLHEFMTWCGAAGVEPMLAVNLGLRGAQEAVDLIEYVNHPGGTALSDLRKAYGAPDPYAIKIWCLGNEMDGPWQVGHKTAHEYGRLARETGRAMRLVDPAIELVACGSSTPRMATFGAWEAEVLTEAYDQVDLISCHSYFEERGTDLRSFLASGTELDATIESVIATVDHVRARTRSKKRVDLSFDEWNVAYLSRPEAKAPTGHWPIAPRISEDEYHVADAVVVGGLLISLLRHSDRIAAACLAQLVNVIAPIRSEPDGLAWRQTTFYPFAHAAAFARGEALRVELVAPVGDTPRYGPVPRVDAVATWDEADDEIAVFLVNRGIRDAIQIEIDARAFGASTVMGCTTLSNSDVRLSNSAAHPDRIQPYDNKQLTADGSLHSVVLPPVSWTVLRLSTAPEGGE